MFDKTNHDLGIVHVSNPLTFEYPYGEDIYLITSIFTPCDCSEVHNDMKRRAIVVKYTPRALPKHLEKQGWYIIAKQIDVGYNLKSQPGVEFKAGLIFNAKVIR